MAADDILWFVVIVATVSVELIILYNQWLLVFWGKLNVIFFFVDYKWPM